MNGDLFKFYIIIIGQKTGFVFHQHHLTSDGWSQGFILNSIAERVRHPDSCVDVKAHHRRKL
ncbi:MAG: hypothetical protein LBC86_06240 [Oscillospiraceae bacterium]|nr:hypothetical protein [Oscillospiraceae bacterium]